MLTNFRGIYYLNGSVEEERKACRGKYSGALEDGTYIKEVIYNNPATIVFWSDKTKTVAKCAAEDVCSKETGLSICVLKKIMGSTKVFKLFDDWIEEDKNKVTLHDVIKKADK